MPLLLTLLHKCGEEKSKIMTRVDFIQRNVHALSYFLPHASNSYKIIPDKCLRVKG